MAELLAAARFAQAHNLALTVHSVDLADQQGGRLPLYWRFVPRDGEQQG